MLRRRLLLVEPPDVRQRDFTLGVRARRDVCEPRILLPPALPSTSRLRALDQAVEALTMEEQTSPPRRLEGWTGREAIEDAAEDQAGAGDPLIRR